MKLERKLFVVGCCIMLISLGLSALATRTITDTSDTMLSSITTSAGGVYPATFAGLQAALNSGNNGTLTVTMPSGIIYYSANIWVRNNTHLQGAGKYQTILKRTGVTTTKGIYVYKDRNVVLSDFTVHGNNSKSGGAATGSSNFYIKGSQNISLININSSYSSGNGLDVSAGDGYTFGIRKFTILNCDITHTDASYNGLNIGDSYNGIINTVNILDSGVDGFDCTNNRNITINNIIITGSTDGIKIGGADATTIAENISLDNINIKCSTNGLKIDIFCRKININNINIMAGGKGIYDYSIYGHININNFVVKSVGMGLITNNAGSNNITFSNGDVQSTTDNCVYLTKTRDVELSNVRIYGGTADLYMFNANRTKIISCNINHARTQHGIIISACSNWTIANCDITDNTASGYGGLNLTGGVSKDFVITGNRFMNNHQYAISIIVGSVNFVITNNIMRYPGSGHTNLVDRSACAAANNVTANNLI